MSRGRVVIIGAGLAGIAASADLTDRGFHAILLERRELLGGRATSFHDASTNTLLDNCQHVLLGCCTELIDLYKRLGVFEKIAFFDTIHFADASGKRGALHACALPAPIHLAPAMLRFPLLSMQEKLEIGRAMASMRMTDLSLDDIAFSKWLLDHDQSQATIDRFWNVIITSALNEDASRASAKYAVQVFVESFLNSRSGYVIGLPTVPLSEVYANAPATELRTSARVRAIRFEQGRTVGVQLGNGQHIEADHVILATAPEAARRILEDSHCGDRVLIEQIAQLEPSPIIGVHFWYDRPILDLPHLALIGTNLQWLFRKDADGRHLHGVISAAYSLVDDAAEQLVPRLVKEIEQVLPDSKSARLIRSRVIKERRATFSPRPGTDRIRPSQHTSIPGLILAGDYTQTGWPATMEGAVRSGRLAADCIGAD